MFVVVLFAALGTGIRADSSASWFHVNGYLTQAYGQADGTPVLGLDEDGTLDYRTAALLFKLDLYKGGDFFVQLAHEALGASPLEELQDDIEVDWLFYQHEFNTGTRLRVGRVPIPFGIYNEIRDVGTILEFYRPPLGIYFEAAFSSESVDGIVLSHELFPQSRWGLDLAVYAGEWDRGEFTAPDVFDGTAEDALGGQLWLNTPVSGLRFGLAAQRFNAVGGLPIRAPEGERIETYLFSVDADFPRFLVRMEAQLIDTSFTFAQSAEFPTYYLLTGLHATEKLDFHLMYEDTKFKVSGGPFPPSESVFIEDFGAGVTYSLSPNVLLRLEGHRLRTRFPDVPLPPGSSNARSDYGIFSVSLSF